MHVCYFGFIVTFVAMSAVVGTIVFLWLAFGASVTTGLNGADVAPARDVDIDRDREFVDVNIRLRAETSAYFPNFLFTCGQAADNRDSLKDRKGGLQGFPAKLPPHVYVCAACD